jgi:amino-acid N-acetyltransferase
MRELRPVGPADPGLIAMLQAARLPVDDLAGGGRYFALLEAGRTLAIGGLDGAGPDQMIRSVVTEPGLRGAGVGREIVEALAERARAEGVERLWLLTNSADAFFARLGWAAADRADAPDPIRTSAQFAGLCPSSAVLMWRSLA